VNSQLRESTVAPHRLSVPDVILLNAVAVAEALKIRYTLSQSSLQKITQFFVSLNNDSL
jgi:hypothetical protein